ncbi:uncharacterized protein LOC117956122 isoform X2 [Etheostoma cragini]|uniref:uncharacterized protein LOC117956122 isoform X2 n=1 Tax=Etheostoma cragini TaxID=417921 RepID=UPI00155EFAF2|nr:uncharacterized protein LOC117956122 isoform X2 [Etheostoma cragini]
METSKKIAPSTKKYVLCKMPAEWATLPVFSGASRQQDCIALYTRSRKAHSLVYEGYIRPGAPEKLSRSALQPPPKPGSFAQKYERLLEKIRAEKAGTKAEEKISVAGQGVVRAEPDPMQGSEDTADESKQQIKAEATSGTKNKSELLNLSLQRTESNTNYPLPLEILERRESLLPVPLKGGTEEFFLCLEPWEDTMDMDLMNRL